MAIPEQQTNTPDRGENASEDAQIKHSPLTKIIKPTILYWGTPVVLITTENEDGTFNIAPMSSAWWLGDRCMLGIAACSKTATNLLRTKQCVLNLASDEMDGAVNALAKTTGTAGVLDSTEDEPLLFFKRMNGYKYVHDKFGHADLTPVQSELIRPARVAECPAQMEAELMDVHGLMQDAGPTNFLALEVKILRTHIHANIQMEGHANRINPDKWRPMIMSFQELYGLSGNKLAASTLAGITEDAYQFQ